MINKDILKKKIIYRSMHRGTKEMDILLGVFVKRNIEKFNDDDLVQLNQILLLDDDILHKWYSNQKDNKSMVPSNNVSKMLLNFKL
jgi:antitoxin CptB